MFGLIANIIDGNSSWLSCELCCMLPSPNVTAAMLCFKCFKYSVKLHWHFIMPSMDLCLCGCGYTYRYTGKTPCFSLDCWLLEKFLLRLILVFLDAAAFFLGLSIFPSLAFFWSHKVDSLKPSGFECPVMFIEKTLRDVILSYLKENVRNVPHCCSLNGTL